MTILLHKICVNDGFSISGVVILMLQTRKIKNCQKIFKILELQALLDEDDLQTQKQQQLEVTQQAVSNCLHC